MGGGIFIMDEDNKETLRQAQGDLPKRQIKIRVDRELCIGAGSCMAVAPGVFALDEENKAYVVDPNGADYETILLAAQSCPTKAIFLYDEEGKQIYP